MADKKLTAVDTSTTMADSDKAFVNVGSAVKQITLTNLVSIIKVKIGSLKNPSALTFTGGSTVTYDGSAAKSVAIPTALKNPYTLKFTGGVSESYDGSAAKSIAIPTIPTSIKNPHKLTFDGAVTAEYDGSGAVTVTIPSGGSGGTATAVTERIEKGSTDTSVQLSANKLYIFPEMSALTITLGSTNASQASEFHFVFQSGATATTFTIPDTVNMPSGFSVKANTVYEVSIMENNACVQSWAVSG